MDIVTRTSDFEKKSGLKWLIARYSDTCKVQLERVKLHTQYQIKSDIITLQQAKTKYNEPTSTFAENCCWFPCSAVLFIHCGNVACTNHSEPLRARLVGGMNDISTNLASRWYQMMWWMDSRRGFLPYSPTQWYVLQCMCETAWACGIHNLRFKIADKITTSDYPLSMFDISSLKVQSYGKRRFDDREQQKYIKRFATISK